MFSSALPPAYARYDLYSGYKVVINDPRPYRNIVFYRTKYSGYKNNRSQEMIRNSREGKNKVKKGQHEYGKWKKENPGHKGYRGKKGKQGKHK